MRNIIHLLNQGIFSRSGFHYSNNFFFCSPGSKEEEQRKGSNGGGPLVPSSGEWLQFRGSAVAQSSQSASGGRESQPAFVSL